VISGVFIARPRLAAVISIVITLAGALAMLVIRSPNTRTSRRRP
jgi:multidrug efflux pump subunit AcrB